MSVRYGPYLSDVQRVPKCVSVKNRKKREQVAYDQGIGDWTRPVAECNDCDRDVDEMSGEMVGVRGELIVVDLSRTWSFGRQEDGEKEEEEVVVVVVVVVMVVGVNVVVVVVAPDPARPSEQQVIMARQGRQKTRQTAEGKWPEVPSFFIPTAPSVGTQLRGTVACVVHVSRRNPSLVQ
ncbi:hypothetical protein LX32DRAFT_650125 [Colletotrichum zoysiae]|uniref:Uncharacterized protein n=1 Tax=Colletotrichum zoysiae TaxID=1216348 RepID=A0AAD9HQG4_9PEZI|nr:hypothetical protein LX32DRAFT_650125 [Colletotrichum zoysiae]